MFDCGCACAACALACVCVCCVCVCPLVRPSSSSSSRPPRASCPADRQFYKWVLVSFLYPAVAEPFFAGVEHYAFLRAYMLDVLRLFEEGPVSRAATTPRLARCTRLGRGA